VLAKFPKHFVFYLPNFSSSKSEGDRLGLRQIIENIPIRQIRQHKKSISSKTIRTPTTAMLTIATDEILIVLSATPTATSKPVEWKKKDKGTILK
jgi:hypothetical protein